MTQCDTSQPDPLCDSVSCSGLVIAVSHFTLSSLASLKILGAFPLWERVLKKRFQIIGVVERLL